MTLPTSHLGTNGIAYVGVRLSENELWRYTRLNENGQITLARKALRASSEKLASQYSFGIFRTNLQIAIFVYNEESGHTESISADSFEATVTEKIAKKDGAYSEDIDVSFSLDGLNLDKINATDITAQVTYKTKSQSPATIKVNGTNCTYVEKGKSDAAVDGTSYYAHTFKVGSLEAGTVMSGQSDYSFKLNLNSVKADDFPTEFLLEVSCNAKTEGLIPFSYAQYMAFTAEGSSDPEPQPDPTPDPEPTPDPTPDPDPEVTLYTITYNLDGGSLAEGVTNPDEYGEASATFTLNKPIKSGYTFAGWTGTGLNEATTEVTITKGSTGDRTYTANYTLTEYKISYITDGGVFADGVASPTLYTVEDAFSIPTPTKTYYNFNFWVDSDGAHAYTIVPGTTGDKTLTASYTPKYFAISYDLADGSLAEGVTNPASYSIESQKITLNNPTKTGYSFVGWSGTGIDGLASDVTIIQGSTGDRSYVASWTLANVLTFTLAEGVTLEMRRCPAGTFTMGSPESEVGRSSNENQHSVTISKDFYMGTYEVTQAQYKAIMGSNPSDHNTYDTGESEANLPVEMVSWDDIMTDSAGFIDKINTQLSTKLPSGYKFDLPTEAQWEYACRAGTTTALNNGKNLTNASALDSNLSEVAWYSQNWGQATHRTHSVGTLASNSFGLYDMHGNVFEWCKDLYASDYYTTCGDCTDPTGSVSGSSRVRRGGGWSYSPGGCRSAYRSDFTPSARNYYIGFRLALVKE